MNRLAPQPALSRRLPAWLAPLMLAGLLLAAPPADAQERCCFRVEARASGTLIANYEAPRDARGDKVVGASEGTWAMEWSWTVRQIARYYESDDRRRRPFLAIDCLGRRCRESPVKMRMHYAETGRECEWQPPPPPDSDPNTTSLQSCEPPAQHARGRCDPNYTLTTNGRFVTLPRSHAGNGLVDFTYPAPNVLALSAAPAGRTDGNPSTVPGVSASGRRCTGAGAGQGTSDHNAFRPVFDGADDLLGGSDPLVAGGPWRYLIEPPRRRQLRRGTRFASRNVGLTGGHPFEHFDPARNPYNRHSAAALGRFEITFRHFPPRRLGRELRELRAMR